LHLSDIHIETMAQADIWFNQLEADLRDLGHTKLDALVVSGDIGNRATKEEYQAAAQLLGNIAQSFGLLPQQIILVPGNHDLNWKLSKSAYAIHRREDYEGPKLVPGQFIDAGPYIEVQDPKAYAQRFDPFRELYADVRQESYGIEPRDQGTLHYLADGQILIVGLNSAWQIDHHFRSRAGIHPEALGRALQEVRKTTTFRDSRVKLAVFHHPLAGEGEDRIKDEGFLQQLAQAGFRFVLHGHIHKPNSALYRYSTTQSIEVIGAGTFGAPTVEWVPGYPLQYQILRVDADALTVETRRREEVSGAWKPDARWLQGPGKDPLPRYRIPLVPA
jgi:3',5'-cyclic AMP phosphodiesterase CpdA